MAIKLVLKFDQSFRIIQRTPGQLHETPFSNREYEQTGAKKKRCAEKCRGDEMPAFHEASNTHLSNRTVTIVAPVRFRTKVRGDGIRGNCLGTVSHSRQSGVDARHADPSASRCAHLVALCKSNNRVGKFRFGPSCLGRVFGYA